MVKSTTYLESTLSEMSVGDLVRCMIILKPGKAIFREGELRDGLKKAAERYAQLNRIFRNSSTGDGTSPPEKTNGFQNAIGGAQAVNLIYQSRDALHTDIYHIRKSHVTCIRGHLQREYGGPRVFDRLQPLADLVWSAKAEENWDGRNYKK